MVPSLLSHVPVIPVVVVEDVEHAVPIARALVAGGVPVIELTLRTPVALASIERIAAEVPEIFLGAGTIVDPGQAKQAASAGAQFLVSPGNTRTLLSAMSDTGLPHLPGVATVSEILTALEAGYTELKFFPAEAAGGADYLKIGQRPDPRRSVLSHRRDHSGKRRGVFAPAERRLCRRQLAHSRRGHPATGLDGDHRTGARNPSPRPPLSAHSLPCLTWGTGVPSSASVSSSIFIVSGERKPRVM
jgi:2-dehydro-3-deoxyphosphogluconate aldolase / (4S)-4-hydroxy-2-oxoglutarate aldolase